MIINPGSQLPANPRGWTNTFDRAVQYANEWHDRMRKEGFGQDVRMLPGAGFIDGRWEFTFYHQVTKVRVKLETHGIDDLEAYRKQAIFDPRIYWNGSSSSEPQLSDFAAPGYVMTFREDD